MLVSIIQAVALAGGLYLISQLILRYINYLITPLHKVPGPKSPNFALGHYLTQSNEPFMQAYARWWKKAGENAPLVHYQGILGQSSLIVFDKNIVKEILTAPAGLAENEIRFQKRTQFLANRIGTGLVSVQGHDWSRHRKIIQPAFHVGFLKEVLTVSVPPRTQTFAESWSKVAGSKREIDLSSHLSALTLDIIGDVAFSHDFHALAKLDQWTAGDNSLEAGNDHDEELDAIDDPVIRAMGSVTQPNALGKACFALDWHRLDGSVNPGTRQIRRALDDAVNVVVQNAKAEVAKSSSSSPKSLLSLLLQARENGSQGMTSGKQGKASNRTLSDQELRDEVKTFIAAGHETTSTLCYWAIYVLATNPDVQDRLFKEIKEMGSNERDGDLLESVEKLEYLDAFLNEVLRLHTPVGRLLRYNRTDENFAGYHIPAGTELVIPTYLLHRHPKYWDEPERFAPERWIHATAESRQEFLDRTRFAFIPFSAGGRNCIGQRFALMEAKLILAQLVETFAFEIAPSLRDTKFELRGMGIPKLAPCLKVCIDSRD